MVNYDDHAMTSYDNGDSYWPWYDYGKSIAWTSWNIAWSCHGDHGNYYKIVRTLNIQPALLITTHVVVRYFLTRNLLNKTIKKVPERRSTRMDFSQKLKMIEKN